MELVSWLFLCLFPFGLNEFVFTSFQRKKERGIAKKVQCTEERRCAAWRVAATPSSVFQKIAQRFNAGKIDYEGIEALQGRQERHQSNTVLPSLMRDFEISCLGYPALKRWAILRGRRVLNTCGDGGVAATASSPASVCAYPVALRLKTSYSSRDSNSGRGSSRAKYRSCRSVQLHLR